MNLILGSWLFDFWSIFCTCKLIRIEKLYFVCKIWIPLDCLPRLKLKTMTIVKFNHLNFVSWMWGIYTFKWCSVFEMSLPISLLHIEVVHSSLTLRSLPTNLDPLDHQFTLYFTLRECSKYYGHEILIGWGQYFSSHKTPTL